MGAGPGVRDSLGGRRSAVPARYGLNALEIDGIWKYYGDFPALRDVGLHIAAGSTVALLGRNGAGKTTLLRIVAGLANPTKGTVRILGQNVREEGARRR